MEANRWEWDRGLVEVGGRVDKAREKMQRVKGGDRTLIPERQN